MFTFDGRLSDSPLVEMIWRTHSERTGSFISQAASRWEMVVMKYQGKTILTVRGPETRATAADVRLVDAEFFGIVFRPGAFMPHLPPGRVMDRNDVNLPQAAGQSFYLHGSNWQYPNYENADTFVQRLVREDLLVQDPIVDAVLQRHSDLHELSLRSVQRRFLRATGLTHGALLQIERARRAAALLEQGASILDAVEQAGYADQPHLTRSLRRFIGETPAQIMRQARPDHVVFVQDGAPQGALSWTY